MKLPDSLYAMVGFAAKARAIVSGYSSVEKSVHKGQVLLVLMDEGTAEHTKEKIMAVCKKHSILYIKTTPMGELGRRIGKETAMIVGITNKMFANRIEEIYNEHVQSAEV